MARKIDLGDHLVPELLAYLSRFASLPESGIVAGQSVSSAILEVCASEPGPVNDVDVFSVVTPEEEEKLAQEQEGRAHVLSLTQGGAALDEYRCLTLSSTGTLDLVKSYQQGLLNRILCSRNGSPSSRWQHPRRARQAPLSPTELLCTFDLNAVEVAIDLASKQLYWTPSFEEFVAHNELKITSMQTPARTLLRYLKKKEELGAYGNDQLVLDMTALWMSAYSSGDEHIVSPKMQQLLERYKGRLESHFRVGESAVPGLSGSSPLLEVQEGWSCPDSLASLDEGELLHDQDDSDGAMRLFPQEAYRAVTGSAAAVKRDFDALQEAYETADTDDDFEPKPYADLLHMSLTLLGPSYLAGPRSDTHRRSIQKMLEEHPDLCTSLFGLTLEQQFRCVQDLRKRAKQEGLYIFGLVESKANWLDMLSQVNRDRFFARCEQQDADTVLVTALFPTWESGSWRIRELVTVLDLRLEGTVQRHCVGGYGSALESGRVRILSVQNGEDRKRFNSTIALERVGPETAATWRIQQHYARGNTAPDVQTREIVASYLRTQQAALNITVTGIDNPKTWASAEELFGAAVPAGMDLLAA